MMLINYLDLTIDYVFKRVFGYAGSEVITNRLLSLITEQEINDLVLDWDPILERDLIDDKVGILDIKARVGLEMVCDIEMQVVDQNNIIERILYYWSKMYSEELKRGSGYLNLKKTIVILFADFEIKQFKEIEKYITQWNIREKDYLNCVLTDLLEIYIIELPKFNMDGSNLGASPELNTWIKFIKNPEVITMADEKNDKALKNAKDILTKISNDEHERRLADLRQKYIWDQQAIAAKGYDNGLKDGIEQGIEQIISAMFEKNLSIEDISKFTNLDIETVKKIISEHNQN